MTIPTQTKRMQIVLQYPMHIRDKDMKRLVSKRLKNMNRVCTVAAQKDMKVIVKEGDPWPPRRRA